MQITLLPSLLLALLAVSTQPLIAATDVSGILSHDTTWSQADSPIRITNDVQVASGVTLAIEAGVTVHFAGPYEILVQGAIIEIQGTVEAPVSFDSSSGTQVAATGIKFEDATLADSTIKWLKVQNVSTAIRIGEEREHDQGGKNFGTLTISNLHLNGGLILTDGYQTTAALTLIDPLLEGVTIKGAYPRSEPITIIGGEVRASELNSDSYNAGITVDGTRIFDSEFTLGCCGANFQILRAHISDSSFSAYNNYYTVRIEDSLLVRTPVNCPESNSVTIINSVIGDAGVSANNLTLTDSSVSGAETGLTLSGTSTIARSNITQCNTGIRLKSQATATIQDSNIANNSVSNLTSASSKTVTATSNYWGFSSEEDIESFLVDHNDDISLGKVTVVPYLTEASSAAPLLPLEKVLKTGSESGVLLTWDSVGDLAVGYRIYYGMNQLGDFESVVDAGDVNTYNLPGATLNEEFAVTYYATGADGNDDIVEGLESWFRIAETPAPALELSAVSLDFSAVSKGTTRDRDLILKNEGTAELVISDIVSNHADFSTEAGNLSILPGQSKTLTVSFSPTGTGSKTASITFTHNGPGGTSKLDMSGYGIEGPGTGASGIVSVSTTWTLAESPVYILGDIQVAPGATLSIEHGVNLLFTGPYEILVQGAVDIQGTQESMVVFDSASGAEVAATGLKFESATLENSSIDWLEARNVATVIRIGEEREHDQGGKNFGTLTVSNLHMVGGLILTDGYSTTAALKLATPALSGVTLKGAYPRSEPITVVGGEILASVINSDSYNLGITIDGTRVYDSEFTLGCCGANIVILGSHLSDSSFSDYNSHYTVTIKNSLLERTPLALGNASKVTIENSQLGYERGVVGIGATNLTLTGSTVVGADVGVSVGGNSTISSSTIANCDTALTLASQSTTTISSTNFLNSESMNVYNNGSGTANASGNYWGYDSSEEIEATIHHKNDDISFGLVEYSGFESEMIETASIAPLETVLKAESEDGVHLSWSAPLGDVAGYKVHYDADGQGRFQSQLDVGLATSHELSNVSIEDSFAVTYYSSEADGVDDIQEGIESWYSYAQLARPEIAIRSAPLDFSAVRVGEIGQLELAISNSGTATLEISSFQSNNAAFSASPSSLSVPTGEARNVTVSYAPTESGRQAATLTITHNADSSQSLHPLSGYGLIGSGTGASGLVETDVVWTLDDSPIYVIGDVQIAPDATLFIESGVNVLFTGDYEILVQGAVDINGSENAPVVFESSNNAESLATGLKFEGATLENSSIQWWTIKNVATAIRIGEESEHDQGGKNFGALTVSDLRMTGGLILTDGYSTTASLKLINPKLDGVTVKGAYPRSEPITIVGGEIRASVLDSDSYNMGITLEDTRIYDSQLTLGCCGANFQISNCQFVDSTIGGHNNGYQVTVESSVFLRSFLALAASSSVTVRDTLIIDGGIAANNLTLTNSSISGGFAGLSLSGTSTISDSSISQCEVGIKLNNQATARIENCNIFLNTSFNLRNEGAESVDATGSYWGKPIESGIEATILHKADDLNRGRVDYSSFLNVPSATPPLSPVLVANELQDESGARELYWSYAIEPGEIGYQIELFESDGDLEPLHTIQAGTINHYALGAEHSDYVAAVVAYKVDPETTEKSNSPNAESGRTFTTSVEQPDWYELFLQPVLHTNGLIDNRVNKDASYRILSWTLPPVVRPGQTVESRVWIEYSPEAHPEGAYDADLLHSLSVFGDWAPEAALSELVTIDSIGDPSQKEYIFEFVAPDSEGMFSLRLASAHGASTVDGFYGANGDDKVGPYADIPVEVVELTNPPVKPTGLQAFGGADTVHLTWTANAEANVEGYLIYRGSSPDKEAMSLITDEIIQTNEFDDQLVDHLATYYYRITAINTAGQESKFSDYATTTASRIVVTVDDHVAAPGSEAVLIVSAENARGVSGNGLDVQVTYDKNLLTPLSVSKTALTESFQLVDNTQEGAGQINVSAVSLDGEVIQGRGALLELRFSVNPDAEIGSIGEHTFTEVRMYNADLVKLDVDFSDSAEFKVSNIFKRGDVSGDGAVDSLDALMALQHAAGLRTLIGGTPAFQAGDINKDGIIDSSDVVLIQQISVGGTGLQNVFGDGIHALSAQSTSHRTLSYTDGNIRTSSATNYRIALPNKEAYRGSIVTVPILIEGPSSIGGADIELNYDPMVLKLLSIEGPADSANYALRTNYRQGSPKISLARGEGTTGASAVSIDLQFKLLGPGGSRSPLRIVGQKVVDASGRDVGISSEIDSQNGSIYITPQASPGFSVWIDNQLPGADEQEKTPNADPDADGLANIFEFASGGDPALFDALKMSEGISQSLTPIGSEGLLLRLGNPGLSIVYYTSADLSTWTPCHFTFDSDQMKWTLDSADYTITSSSEKDEGLWNLVIKPTANVGGGFLKIGVSEQATGSEAGIPLPPTSDGSLF